jgi:hypothetical protein
LHRVKRALKNRNAPLHRDDFLIFKTQNCATMGYFQQRGARVPPKAICTAQ